MSGHNQNQRKQRKPGKRWAVIIVFEFMILLALFGTYRWYITTKADVKQPDTEENNQKPEDGEGSEEASEEKTEDTTSENTEDTTEDVLTPEEQAALVEQERLQNELKDRQELIVQADQIALGYDYEGAIKLLQAYEGSEGNYKLYPTLMEAIKRLGEEESALVLCGGSYRSVTEVNHIFFHSLIADTARAFDSDYDTIGYNMYMTTISEFNKILQKMYDDGYVLVSMSDLTKKVTLEDGSTKYEEGDIFLREGKKPLVISQDDVSYYAYMNDDGFASRIIIGEDGKPTCEMILEDGTTVTGSFDMVPLLDDFIEKHPDFSYKGAKGLLAVTGYEGVLGYRTNDTGSATYEKDKAAAIKVAEALKTEGWEFGSHSWGHKNMLTSSYELLKRDTNRWLKEVAPILGPTDIYVFPFGVDIETTTGTYSSDKYHYLKESGFNIFVGVYSKPWMHIKKDYVRMTRRPLDGQAMLEFPERLTDLFSVDDIIDPNRPGKNW